MNHLKRAASWYVSLGYWVLPLHSPCEFGGCTCGKPDCGSPGKHPRTKHGLKDASCDPEKIEDWWREWPTANVGILTGKPSGIVVLDIDPRHGGDESLVGLIQEHGDLPITVEAATGGGGRHFIFKHPGGRIGNRANIRPGIDFRGDGGYIVAPPSEHASGRKYSWLPDKIPGERHLAPMPEWLLGMLLPARGEEDDLLPANGDDDDLLPAPKGNDDDLLPAADDEKAALLQAARRYVDKIPSKAQGERNNGAFKLAGHLNSFETDNSHSRLMHGQILELVGSWNQRNDPPLDDSELQRAVVSGIKNGTPRKPHLVKVKRRRKKSGKGKVGGSGSGSDSFSTKLVNLVNDLVGDGQVDLFRSTDGLEEAGYASFYVGEYERRHQETYPIKSSGFKLWLRLLAYNELEKVNDRGVAEAAEILSAKAFHEGEVRQVGLRVAGDLYQVFIDLADATWNIIAVLDGVLQIIPAHECPIRFVRRKGMLPLSEPKPGVGLAGFRELVNLSDDADWHRLLAWMVTALRPVGPYPILLVDGEAGSAKTTLCRLVRSLIDPHKVLLRRPPKDEQDVMIGACNSWIPAYDNISGLSPTLSDALCSLATGGGFGTRQLYTNGEEHLIDVARPIMINGIDDLVSRGDLLDRSLRIHLPPIPSARRKTEVEIFGAFESLRAGALYELLKGVQTAFRDFHSARPATSLRMADFGKWATAAEAGLNLPKGAIVTACLADREDADAAAIEASAVGPAVLRLARDFGIWKGTASELLALLSSPANNYSTDLDHRSRDWPKSANYLSQVLNRLAPHLRRMGIQVVRGRAGHNRVRHIILQQVASETTPTKPPEGDGGIAGAEKSDCASDEAEDDDGYRHPDHRPRYRPPKNTEKTHSRLKNAGADDAADAADILTPILPSSHSTRASHAGGLDPDRPGALDLLSDEQRKRYDETREQLLKTRFPPPDVHACAWRYAVTGDRGVLP